MIEKIRRIPFLNPQRVPTIAEVGLHVSQRTLAESVETEEIRTTLDSLGASLNGALTDLLRHPDQTLSRKSMVQALYPSSKPDYLHTINIGYDDISSDKTNSPHCEDVLFSHSPNSQERYLGSNLVYARALYIWRLLKKVDLDDPCSVSIFGFPDYVDSLAWFHFNSRGRLTIIGYRSGIQRLPTWYNFQGIEFEAYDCSDNFELDSRRGRYRLWHPTRQLGFRYLSADGTFRREPVGDGTPTIQQEITQIIHQLDLDHIDLN